MKVLSMLILAISFSANADSAKIIYTEGSDSGKQIEHTGFLGYYSTCFEGNAWAARNILKSLSEDDIEKKSVAVWYESASDDLEYTFVNTKCLDDSLDATDEGCTEQVIIPRCE